MEEENFLRDYTEYNSGTEIPKLFAFWCGVAGISAVLGRRVFIDMGTYTIFPNFYIVLVAGSGRCRKSTAISQIEKLLRGLEPPLNLIAQKITPEALIDAMKIKESENENQLLLQRTRSEGYVLVDELATFLNKASYEAGLASLLIPFYDCKDNFDYRTKGGGSIKITDSCLGILGASTVDWLTNAIPENAVGGGLTSRMCFVFVEDPPDPVAITTLTERKKELAEILQKHLTRMMMLSGPVKLTNEAWEYYTQEYLRFHKQSELYDNKNLAGYASRRHLHLLKLGIVLSVSERMDLVVEAKHLVAAENMLSYTEQFLPMVMNLITASEYGSLMSMVVSTIRKSEGKSIARTNLVRAMSHKIGSRDLDVILETLQQSGRVHSAVNGKDIYYRVSE
jgi:hypothetical protein